MLLSANKHEQNLWLNSHILCTRKYCDNTETFTFVFERVARMSKYV